MAVLSAAQLAAAATTAPFSIDLLRFTYSYGSVVHQPDFTIAGGFPGTQTDPASGWFVSWNALEVPITSSAVGSAWRLTTQQASAVNPSPAKAMSSINGYNLPAGYPSYAPADWVIVADLQNISNATNDGTFYSVDVGVGNYGSDQLGATVSAGWFTGDLAGTHYDHVLTITSSVSLPGGFTWFSGSPSVLLTDLNPQATKLSLKVEITGGGQIFSSYYKRDADTNWTLAQTFTLPKGTGVIGGFAASHPYISVSNGLAPSGAAPTAAPSAPSGLSAFAVAPSSVTLRWQDKAANEKNYLVYRYNGSGWGTPIATLGGDATGYTDNGLQPSSTYYYLVCTQNSVGSGCPAGFATVTTPSTIPAGAPTAPNGLAAVAVSSSAITVNWVDKASNEANYLVYRYNGSGWGSPIATLGANVTNYSDTGLQPSTTYNYWVCAQNSAGSGCPSGFASATTQAGAVATAPAAPSGLGAAATSSSTVTVSWTDKANNESSYLVYRYNGSGWGSPIATLSANATTYADTGLQPSTTYYYWVCAQNSVGSGCPGGFATVTTQAGVATAPAAPSGLSAVATSSSSVTVNWVDNANNETGYLVYRYNGAGWGSPIATLGANTTTYTNTGLQPSTIYYYWVCAQNSVGSSCPSGFATVTTQAGVATAPAAPSGLSAVATSSSSVTVNWVDNANNETGYLVYRYNGSGWGAPIATLGANTTSYADTGLLPSTAYFYWVCSQNSLGSGCPSGFATVTTQASVATAPAAPSGLSAVANSSSSITINWIDNANNETSYLVYRYNGSGWGAPIATLGANTAAYSDTGLQPSTTYFYWVCAQNSIGSGCPGGFATVTTQASVTNSLPVITAQPTDQTVVALSSVTFSVSAVGTPSPTYQWQISSDGTSFSNVPGATSSTYTIPSTAISDSGKRLRVIISNAVGSVTSAVVILSVNASAITKSSVNTRVVGDLAHTCAITSSSQVACWGSGTYGMLGDGGSSSSIAPKLLPSLSGATGLAAGKFFTCASKADGTVACWGYNYYGQLGDQGTTNALAPRSVPGLTGATLVAAGERHACALLSNSTVSCWGNNNFAQLGIGVADSNDFFIARGPTPVPGLTDVVSITAGDFFTCALKSDGTVYCWGGAAGIADFSGSGGPFNTPALVQGLSGVTSIDAGSVHICAVKSDRTVTCWGSNAYGQLGNGTANAIVGLSSVPNLIGAVAVSSGPSHTCALLSDTTMSCWGWNQYGAIGDGTTGIGYARFTPTAVSGMNGVLAMSATGSTNSGNTCAIKSDGTAWCWGRDNGQLGVDGVSQSSCFGVGCQLTPARVISGLVF
jgi:alpha-tubulin suppressor-like RCC1 family protein